MKQAQRVPMEDGAEKRRKYLQTIVGARTLGCIGWTLIVGFVLPTMLLAAGAVVSIIVGHDIGLSIFCLVLTLFPGAMVYLGVQGIRNANKMADDNLYVPPIREQIADLRADEILLRGSDQPAALPVELLRAAREGAETEAEELLRAESRTA